MDLWEDDLPPPRDELLRRIAGCDGVLTLLTDRVDDAFLDAAGPGLRVVSNYAVGFDNIDVAACAARGVAVGNTPGVLTETTADLAWALLMAAARRLPEGDRYVRDGRWKTWGPLLLLGPDVHGATLGIVGFGRIGQALARRAQGFGMRILYHDVEELPADVTGPLGATYRPLEGLLAESDFVSLHVNLSPVTRHLINRESLGWMKSTAVLVNTSRGPVIDQAALAEALRDGVIWAAALDVTDPEPISMDDPLVGLGQLPDRAPHRVGVADDARQDGRDGRREPAGRGARGTAADARHRAGVVMAFANGVLERARAISLGWLVVVFTVAQLLDLVSALVVAREMNPIVAAMVEQPLVGVALKLALIALVVATAEICDRQRPGLARLVLIVGAVAGLVGALSNTHLTPFLSA